MRILIDIGHPAHVHYFRNLIKKLENEGHHFLVFARDKEVTHQLLKAYDISFIDKGPGGRAFLDRIEYTFKSLVLINREIESFNPDLCISFFSPYLSVISSLHRIPHLMFNDTEGQLFFKHIIRVFNSEVFSPESYIKPDKKHQTLFPSYMELAYLHPDLYSPDPTVLGVTGKDYILLRFVSDKASHDVGHPGISDEEKKEMFHTLSTYKKVWISSEEPLPDDLQPYRLAIPPEKIHDVIAHASLLIGGSATMSSEAAMLGVPSIFIHDNVLGYIKELDEKYNLVHQFRREFEGVNGALQKAQYILSNGDSKSVYKRRSIKMISEKKNLTDFMKYLIQQTASSISKRG